MSTSAFAGPHAHRGARSASGPATQHGTSGMTSASVLAQHRESEWLGHKGEQLRVRVVVEHVTTTARTFTHLLRVDGTHDLIEWSTPRRYGITAGERLALSGLVKAHTTRDATRVTVLRDCFNPLRMT